MKTLAVTGVLTLALITVFAMVSGTALAEVPAKPTFTRDVLPILQENCQECHRQKPINISGMVAPFALTEYAEVRPWAKAISKAVQTKIMPPWFATEEFDGVFRNERGLSEDEIATIVKWVDMGAARGRAEDAPDPVKFRETEWWLGEPDLIVPLPEPIWVGDEVEDWQPNIEVPLSDEMLPADRWIRTIEAQAGSEPVHHIVIYSTGGSGGRGGGGFGGKQIGGLAPGAEPTMVQDGYGIHLKKGSNLRLSMHYHKEAGPGTGVWDRSRLGFFFYPDDADVTEINIEPIGAMDFEIPPGKADWVVGMARTFDRPIRVLNMLPHMHLRGVAAEYTAFYTDGTSESLLDVPRYDYNWQLYYEYPEPRSFPAGTRIEVRLTYDNSTDNLSNPDPTSPTGFGLETSDEMAFGWMYYAWDEGTGAASDD